MFDFHTKRIYIIHMNKLTTTIASLIALASISLADVGTTSNTSGDDVTAESVFASIGDLLLVRPVGAAVTVANFGILLLPRLLLLWQMQLMRFLILSLLNLVNTRLSAT